MPITPKMQQLLDELLAEDELANAGHPPVALHQHIHDLRRRKAHARAKAAQPCMQTLCHPEDFATLVEELRAPITPAEEAPGGLDQLAMTVKECEAAGDFHDLLFALVRFYRKGWGENHFGAIQAAIPQKD